MRVILVRHGQTDYNRQKILQGHIDTPLNETGLQQAECAGRQIAKENRKIDAIWSSDLQRCRQTTEMIVTFGNLEGVVQTFDSELRERSMGELEGMPVGKAHQRAEEEGRHYHDYGEAKRDFTIRLRRVWNKIIDESTDKGFNTIMIVSHGGTTSQICHHLVKDEGFVFSDKVGDNDIRVPHNCSFTELSIDESTGSGIIETFGDARHIPLHLTNKVDQRAL